MAHSHGKAELQGAKGDVRPPKRAAMGDTSGCTATGQHERQAWGRGERRHSHEGQKACRRVQRGSAARGSRAREGRGRGSGARRRSRAAHLRGGAAAAHGVRGSLPCRCPLGARRRRRASVGHPLAATVCPRRGAAENRRGTAGPYQASAAAALAPPRRPLMLPPQRRRPRLRRRGGACVWVWPPGAGPGTAARGVPAQPHRSGSTPPRAARREWFLVSQWLLPRCQGDAIAGGRRLGAAPALLCGPEALLPSFRSRAVPDVPSSFPPGGGGAAQGGQHGADLRGEGVWWSGWFLSG